MTASDSRSSTQVAASRVRRSVPDDMAAITQTQTTAPAALLAVFDLRRIVGESWVLSDPDDLLLYEYDGSVDRALPDAVVFPDSTPRSRPSSSPR